MKHLHLKFSYSVLAAAGLLSGCEWTGSADSDSWSGNYDALNFAGTYRAVAVQTSTTTVETTTTTASDSGEKSFTTVSESGGSFSSGATAAAGTLSHGDVVPGSVQVSVGGKYIWTDNGSGSLVLGGGSSAGSGTTSSLSRVSDENQGKFQTKSAVWAGTLAQKDIDPGSVQIKAGAYTWMDDGAGNLVCEAANAHGSVLYSSGAWSIDITNMQRVYLNIGSEVSVSATYSYVATTGTTIEGVSGNGTILYSSGAWSVSISPSMPANNSILISYSYYVGDNSTSTGATTTSSASSGWSTGTSVTAATVSQTGQNLTISLNNGIVMVGRFTSVNQTGEIDEDTGAGANTYNAQFQVASGNESKMVGNLYYDYSSHNRILDATWTWGKNTYDVHGIGPSWTEAGVTTQNLTED